MPPDPAALIRPATPHDIPAIEVFFDVYDGKQKLGYILKQEPAIAAFEAKRVGSVNTLR